MGRRIQGVIVRALPGAHALAALRDRYAFRLFEAPGSSFWLIDLGIAGAPDRATVREARTLAPSYVDAIRVINAEEHVLEQLCWLVATATAARLLNEPVMGFLSDDERLDFAALASPAGVSAVGDHVAPYLLRWDAGVLQIQPYVMAAGDAAPQPPEELALLRAASILPAEPLPDGTYPVHGNVTAEMLEFAPLAAAIVEAKTANKPAGLRVVDARGLESSGWDS